MRNWHDEEEELAREMARQRHKLDIGWPTYRPPPRPLIEWFEGYLDRRFRDGQPYGHLQGKNIALHHDAIHAMCEGRGWCTTSLSPAEIIVFCGP